MQQYVIIVAGGSGSRMKTGIPKQFISVAGQPVIIRTIRCFLKYDPSIRMIISVHPGYKTLLETLLSEHRLMSQNIVIVLGGETRFHSVKNGLNAIEERSGVVGIHDAARPFVSQQTIANCFETAAIQGNAVPCVPVNESMRKVDEEDNVAVSRADYRIIQTPQCFSVTRIKAAFEQEYSASFTDDATVLESTGESIHLVSGNEENIKITSPHDLIIANALAHNDDQR